VGIKTTKGTERQAEPLIWIIAADEQL